MYSIHERVCKTFHLYIGNFDHIYMYLFLHEQCKIFKVNTTSDIKFSF